MMGRLLFRGLLVSLALWTLPAQAQQVSKPQVEAMVEALRLAAPKTGVQDDGLYSQWQITPGIIPSWSRQCLGREVTPKQLESSPAVARSIVSCIMNREILKQYAASNKNEITAVRRTACWWMTGNPTSCTNGQTARYPSFITLGEIKLRANSGNACQNNGRPTRTRQHRQLHRQLLCNLP